MTILHRPSTRIAHDPLIASFLLSGEQHAGFLSVDLSIRRT